MKYGYPPVIFPFGIKDDYYNALQFADSDDFDKFIVFIGERLIESLNLVLKVGKNEPIEEADDVDKMVKMLEQQLSGIDEDKTLQKELTFESFKDTFEKSIKPLIIILFEKIGLFAKLFNNYKLLYNLGKGEILLKSKTESYLTEFLDLCYDFIKEQQIIKVIEIYFVFNGFKKMDEFPLNAGVRIEIYFNQYNYIIKSAFSDGFEIIKKYHEILKDDDISFITVELAKYIHNDIAPYIENLKNGK
jgi:hypothetical protein